MKVAIVNPVQRRFSGGYFKYLGEMMTRLETHPSIADLTVWLPEGVECPDASNPTVRRWAGGMTRGGIRELRRGVLTAAPDVVFVPTARHVGFGAIPSVVMVRNMEPLKVPFGGNDPGEALRNLARAAVARRACVKAAGVIAVSRHVRDFLTSRWRLSPARVGVVYHGVTPGAAGVVARRPGALDGGRHAPFLFTAGSLRAARGLEDIIAAMPDLLRDDPTLTLVIAGRWDPGSTRYRRRIMAMIARLKLEERLVWVGHQSPAEMTWCFEHADAFVMTSRAEACPNIALEALGSGASTASTSEPPMPEFLGDAAVYYEPRDGAALAARVRELRAEGDDARANRRARAIARSRSFDWAATVDGTIEQLRQAVRSAPAPHGAPA